MIAATIVKLGANAQSLRLIGDRFIGYRFVPRNDAAKVADELLEYALNGCPSAAEWYFSNRDGDYNSAEWNGGN